MIITSDLKSKNQNKTKIYRSTVLYFTDPIRCERPMSFDALLTSLPCCGVMSVRRSRSRISLHPSCRLLCGCIFVGMWVGFQ